MTRTVLLAKPNCLATRRTAALSQANPTASSKRLLNGALLGNCGTFSVFTPHSGQRTRYTVNLVPRARSCHKLRLASVHTPNKSVSDFLACAEPTASASCPPHRSRAGRPDTPATPVLCSSPPLSSCRVYPESPKIKTPISAGGLTVSRSEPEFQPT